MKYLELFNELQLSRDYIHDKRSGADWRYHVDDAARRVYLEVQETKTGLDWLHNINVIPVKITNPVGKSITVPMGAWQQAEVILNDVLQHLKEHANYTYDWYFCGWSQGGMSSGIAGFMLEGICTKLHYIGWGTPAFLWGKKSLTVFYSAFITVDNFLYSDDWIKSLIPLYKRPASYDVKPVNPNVPKTLDQRHRVYGHCFYSTYYKEDF